MRRNLLLSAATTTALIAGAIAWPAAAFAADPQPQVAGLAALQTSHGYVLQATTTGAVGHVTFTLRESYPNDTAGPDIDITIGQPAADGSWQTTAPLDLPAADYYLSAHAYAPDGTPSYETFVGGCAIPIKPLPVFHDTAFSPGPLSYDNPVETVTGTLTTYDPNTGDTSTPWTRPINVTATGDDGLGSGSTATTHTLASGGSFHIAFQPAPAWTGDEPVAVTASLTDPTPEGCPADTVTGPATTIPVTHDLPTRILLDHNSATATAGTPITVTGTLQYQNSAGWHPLPSTWLFLNGDGTTSGPQAVTDTTGRFAFTTTAPDATATWPVNMARATSYLATTQADFTITSVPDQPALELSGASIDANSNLTFHQSITSPTSTPGGTVQLQQSADGRTGWTTITTLPAATATHTVHASNPHGHWRLYTPTAPGYAQAVSDTVHTFRYQTRITGGPTTTSVRPGTWVHFTGTLAQQGYGPWTPDANQTVQLWFRPTGSTRSYLDGTAHTNTQGYLALWARPTTSGTWTLSYQATSVWNTNASTTATIQVS
ncbi:hypothetical protein [Streptacidiphilus fuscans]|uniref:Uncharacterized protein n=1 Tax=Streptacidiphilus fuscans TaxID=2789292 RepID=A0A931B9J4_9ACTN|nr:hypothetical protein [Streptacidiphilus fuscans]MBF9071536.1 hypothetical protein [Streptacidiphilus fuscans]